MSEPGPSVGRLIHQAHRDDAAAGELLERFRNYLTVLARGAMDPVLRPKLASSDVVQEVILRAYAHFDTFRGTTEGELVAWLRAILVRQVVDLSRRYRGTAARFVLRERPLESRLERSSAALCRLAASQTSPSDGVQRREIAVTLADAITRLTHDQREVILLRQVEGLRWREVAQRMGRTRQAVSMLWVRALEKLRTLLREEV